MNLSKRTLKVNLKDRRNTSTKETFMEEKHMKHLVQTTTD
jgi:hypothetical protein